MLTYWIVDLEEREALEVTKRGDWPEEIERWDSLEEQITAVGAALHGMDYERRVLDWMRGSTDPLVLWTDAGDESMTWEGWIVERIDEWGMGDE